MGDFQQNDYIDAMKLGRTASLIIFFSWLNTPCTAQMQGMFWPVFNQKNMGASIDFSNVSPQISFSQPHGSGNGGSVSNSKGELLAYLANGLYNSNHDTLISPNDFSSFGAIPGIIGQHSDSVFSIYSKGSTLNSQNLQSFFLLEFLVKLHEDGNVSYTSQRYSLPGNSSAFISAYYHTEGKKEFLVISSNDTFYIFNAGSKFAKLINSQAKSLPLSSKYELQGYSEIKFGNTGAIIAETGYSWQIPYDTSLSIYTFYDFDTNTASIRYRVPQLKSKSAGLRLLNPFAFSPTDSVFYFSEWLKDNSTQYLVQYNINAGKSIRIFEFHFGANSQLAPLQALAITPLGTIIGGYIFGFQSHHYLGEIKFPDSLGTKCGFNPQGLFKGTDPKIFNLSVLRFPTTFIRPLRLRFTSGQLCGMDSFWLTNRSDTTKFVRFRWHFSPTDSLDGLHAMWRYGRSGRYAVSLDGWTAHGFRQTWTDSVTYLAPPRARFVPRSHVACQYVAFHFADLSAADTFNGPGQRIWDFGDGTTLSYAGKRDTVHHTYTASGLYQVRLIFSNGICNDTFTLGQRVEVLPAALARIALSDSVACAPYTLSARSDADAGVAQTWTLNGQPAGQGLGITLPLDSPGVYRLSLSILSPTGCLTTDTVSFRLLPGAAVPLADAATFSADNQLTLRWHSAPGALRYVVERGTGPGWEIIATTDDTALAIAEPVMGIAYRVRATNPCEFTPAEGAELRPIYLDAQKSAEETIALNWSAHRPALEGPLTLHRDGQPLGIAAIPPAFDLDFWDSTLAEHCYRVGLPGRDVWSNRVCIAQSPWMHLPSAFSPNGDGLNDAWQPRCSPALRGSYSVYNRWGQRLFQSPDLNTPWVPSTGLPLDNYFVIYSPIGQPQITKVVAAVR